jgi:hypothetical protein
MTTNTKCRVAIATSLAISLMISVIKVAHADQPMLSFKDAIASRPAQAIVLNLR